MLFSEDTKTLRQLQYWGATVVLYSISLTILWFEVWAGEASPWPAVWLTSFSCVGIALFYLLIRASEHIGLRPAQLAVYQGNFAIICIVAAYAICAPVRGATLTIFLVVLVFCAFALEPEKSYRMGIFAIVLLGITMLWKVNTDPGRFPPRQETIHFLLAATMLVVVAYLTGELNQLRAHLKAQKSELSDALSRIQVLATRDELTSLANRRHMSEILANEERRHIAVGHPVCIALIDLDWFKQINDTYGHAVGDDVLRMFAQQALLALRATDVLARWGGEEFLLLLPDTELHAAKLILDRLQEHIATLRIPEAAPDLRVTFSAGLIALSPGEPVAEGIRRSDHVMYDAKLQGRNRIVTQQLA